MSTNIELSKQDREDIQADKRNRARRSQVGVGTPTASVLRRRASNLCQFCSNHATDCMTCGWDKASTQRSQKPGSCDGCADVLPANSIHERCYQCA